MSGVLKPNLANLYIFREETSTEKCLMCLDVLLAIVWELQSPRKWFEWVLFMSIVVALDYRDVMNDKHGIWKR